MILMSALQLSCANGPLQRAANSPSPTPEMKLTAVERDIQSLKTANLEYIFVMRRKDGGVIDREDIAYAKANSPADTNRWLLSDKDRAAIAGSSFKFENENLIKLRERFIVEDHSVQIALEPNVKDSNE